MRKKRSNLFIFIITVITLFLLSSTGCSSSRNESKLTGSSDETEGFIYDAKLSSESFLGTGIQLPSAGVLRSISFYDGYTKETVIFESNEDISRILVFLNSIIGRVEPIDESTTMVIGYKFDFNYKNEVDSSSYVDSLIFGTLSFFYSSRVIAVTNYSGTELEKIFESHFSN